MNILIMGGVVIPRDAIGNDIATLYRVLAPRHRTVVYGEKVEVEGLRRVSRPQAEDLLADPETLAVYHHSFYWPAGEEMLDRARARIVMRFHNITPPSFFEPYSADYTHSCREGRGQTKRLAHRHAGALWLADSTFNIEEGQLGALAHVQVVPPFNPAESFRTVVPDSGVLHALSSREGLNVLFVGRVAPNKGYHFLLEVVRDYRLHYDEPLVLHLIGRRDARLATFNAELDARVVQCGIGDGVHWTGALDNPELLAYFLGCDVYLNCSEHEGFCVPIVECQSLGLPVIARSGGAVEETLAGEQLVLGDDPADYSAALRVLAQSQAYRDHLTRAGAANYAHRFTENAIAECFRTAVENYVGKPL